VLHKCVDAPAPPRRDTAALAIQGSLAMPMSLSCHCGASRILATGNPLMHAYCHCQGCRELTGASVVATSTWRSGDLGVAPNSRPLGEYLHATQQMSRHFCTGCGDVMFLVNALGMRAVPHALLEHACQGSVPALYAPVMHLHYAQRRVDVLDDLPKYLERAGGPRHGVAAAMAGIVATRAAADAVRERIGGDARRA